MNTVQRILVPADFSACAGTAAEWAASLSRVASLQPTVSPARSPLARHAAHMSKKAVEGK